MKIESTDPSEPQPRRSVVNSAAYHNGVRVADVPIADLEDAWNHSDRFLWVGLYEPSEKLLSHIQQAFGLHDLAIEDAHKGHQRPKLEVYDNSMFVIIRTARLSYAPPYPGLIKKIAPVIAHARSGSNMVMPRARWTERGVMVN